MSEHNEPHGKIRHAIPGVEQGTPLDYALRYAALGWAVLPLHTIHDNACTCDNPGCRTPGKHPIHQLAPRGLHNATTDAKLIQAWYASAPWANVGIATGERSGIFVVDLDRHSADGVESWQDHPGDKPGTAEQITGSGGQHLVYRYPTDNRVGNRTGILPGVDVRGDGGYIVAEPSRHISGQAYIWEASSDPLDGVPIAYPPPWVLALVTESRAGGGAMTEAPPLTREQALEIRSALYYLDPDDYDSWIYRGMEIHSAAPGVQGFGLWSEWSQQSSKFDPAMQRKKWDSFRRDDRGLPSLFAEAQARGWVNTASNASRGVITPVATGQSPILEPTANAWSVPDALLNPPGRLSEIAGWITQTAARPQPVFSVQGAIALVSVLAGRRYVTDQRNYSSLYLLNIGPSTAGKEHPKTCVESLLESAGLDHIIGPSSYMSGSAVVSHLLEKPCHLAIIDELGALLESANNSGMGHRRESLTQLIEAFGRCHGTLRPAGYSTMTLTSQQREEAQGRLVRRPALSLLAMTTPGTFYGSLSLKQVESGFLGRFLIAETPTGRRPAQPAPWVDPPEHLTQWARDVAMPSSGGNLAGINLGPDMPPAPIIVPFSGASLAMLAALDAELINEMDALDGDGLAPLLGRTREIAMRLSLVTAIACDAVEEIPEDLTGWAIEYTRFWCGRTVQAFRDRVTGSEFQERLNDCMEAIRRGDRGRAGLTTTELNRHRAFARLKPRERDEIMDALKAAGMVEYQEIPTGRRPRRAWVAVQSVDSDTGDSDSDGQ